VKKSISLLIAGILIMVVTCSVFYYLGFIFGAKKVTNINQANDVVISDVFGRVDYPLVDIFFDSESKWLVIDRSSLLTDSEKFKISQDSLDLQFNKECLKLVTFPVGRGTTPMGIVYVYKDEILVREIPYIEAYYKNEGIEKAFRPAEKSEIESILSRELPSAI
jgi:hypothetical protein